VRRLTLYRHAKTERDSESGRDFDRRLTDQGREDAARIGREIEILGLRFDQILVSPARRAMETADGAGLAAESDKRIYNASVEELLAIVEGTDDCTESLMLIGHNPGFERLASRLIGDAIEMPTGSLFEMALPIERWKEVGEAKGRTTRFLKPKELR
jgi:phosphohistidine phosphatase